ncbi:hypothetical protein CALVIDRAFT_537707 [Calocera viscosa TUFC12733]|uniref:Cupredoxin n=1 Tax=Calocera viscosa (strain TUFC12733) TaxID=1330018 RepID=A0A167LIA3_CALVF|nr:hypothetical protein CALVIDRAFT_537707 [Calocera viscosa TUFC12733]
MYFPTLLAALAVAVLPAAVSAQTATGANHQIIVGMNGTVTYTPASITAAMGDTVTFVFVHGNHTVTQSTFATPCIYAQNATAGTAGFQSGFQPVAANQTLVPSVTMMVNTTAPIWFYCQQGTHCEQGMVGAINAVESSAKSYEAFKALAMAGGMGAASTNTMSGSGSMTSAAAAPSKTSGGMTKVARNAGAMLVAVGVVVAVLL